MTDPKNDAYVDDITKGYSAADERVAAWKKSRQNADIWLTRVERNIINTGWPTEGYSIERDGRSLNIKFQSCPDSLIIVRCDGQQLHLSKAKNQSDGEAPQDLSSTLVCDENAVRDFFKKLGEQISFLSHGPEWV